MQRLVTIYLDSQAYLEGRWLAGSFGDKHGRVEEHLAEELREGWRVVSVTGFVGGAEGAVNARGWFAVVLEK
jgi:hypothetical protein